MWIRWQLFVVILFVVSCENKGHNELSDIESLRQEVKPTEVTTTIAQFREFEYLINSSGTIESENELEITYQSSGYLKSLNIRNGDLVSFGQTLAELENEKEKLALAQAQVNFDNSMVRFISDSLSYSKITPTIIRSLKLQSGVASAEIGLQQAQLDLSNSIVRSPLTGIIAELESKQGNLVSSGETLGLIYDPNNLILKSKILEVDFRHIKIGLVADVFPLAFRDRSFSARIIEFNPKVDDKGMIEVTFKLTQTDGLLPGMNANTVVRVPQSQNIIVPREALVIKSGRPVVFTLEDGLAKWNYVETGLDNGIDLEILSGINEGDHVIISNNLQLGHDARVARAQSELNDNE